MAQNTINVKAKGYSTANAYQFRITANDTGNISGSKREVECYLDSYATNPGGFYDESLPRAYILIDGVQYQSAVVSKIWPRGQWVRLVTWKGYIESNKTITVTGRFNSNLESVNYMPVKGNNDVSVNLELNGVASKLNNTFSALTFDVEQPITLDITKYVESYTQNIRWVIYNETTQIETLFATFNNVENGSVIQLSQEQLNALYQNTTTIKMPALGMYLDTYDGETLIGSDRVPMVIRILNADPIFTDFDYADSNSITNSLTNSAQDIILGYSALKVTIPTSKKAVGQKYATMQSYIIDTVPINYSENEINLEIPNYNSNKIIVSAIDSRQKQTNVEKQLNIINYNPVEVNTTEVEIERTNGSEEETKISFSGTFWNGNFGKTTNSLTISYKYRLAGSTGDYSTGTTTITPTINESSFSVVDKAILGDTDSGFDISQSYEIVFEIKDKLEDLSKCEITCILSAGSNAIDIKGNKVLKINDILFENLLLPSGSVIEYAGNTAPNGWLICDGSAISRKIYSNLFEVIGSTFGSGDGTTTFNIPNLKGKIPVGLNSDDSDFNILGKTGGEKTHILTTNEMPSHNHRQTVTASRSGSGNTYVSWNANNLTGNTDNGARNTLNTGGGQAHNNLQPYIVLNYIIKY